MLDNSVNKSKKNNYEYELTILMPCLNEAETVGECVKNALSYLSRTSTNGEVLVCDNESTDNSADIARSNGARVVVCNQKGYGNALRYGMNNAKGKYIIFADCDMSYDFLHLDNIHDALRSGARAVTGNRLTRPRIKGAMPLSHRFGVPVLSFLGRIRYHCDIRDFHCGLRGIRSDILPILDLQCTGMEFATEMIAKCCKNNIEIKQVPITLYPDGRSGKPHLNTIRDGIRHLRYILFGKA